MNYRITLHRAGHTPENVHVYSLAEASATLTAFQRKHAMGSSDMGELHGDVVHNGKLAYRVSYNGRVWARGADSKFSVLALDPDNA